MSTAEDSERDFGIEDLEASEDFDPDSEKSDGVQSKRFGDNEDASEESASDYANAKWSSRSRRVLCSSSRGLYWDLSIAQPKEGQTKSNTANLDPHLNEAHPRAPWISTVHFLC